MSFWNLQKYGGTNGNYKEGTRRRCRELVWVGLGFTQL